MTKLETTHLYMFPASLDDFVDFATLYGDPKVMKNMKLGVLTADQTRDVLRGYQEYWSTHGFGVWSVVLKETRVFLGECGFWTLEGDNAIALRVSIIPDYWRRGFAQEAVTAALEFGFEKAGCDPICAITLAKNTPSRKFLEKFGMTVIRRSHEEGADLVRYAMSKSVWRQTMERVKS